MTTYQSQRRRRRRIYLEPADGWVGVYRGPSGDVFWCPLPFLVVRWTRSTRSFGLLLSLLGLVAPVMLLPWPLSLVGVLWLAGPGAVALWWAWRDGALL